MQNNFFNYYFLFISGLRHCITGELRAANIYIMIFFLKCIYAKDNILNRSV